MLSSDVDGPSLNVVSTAVNEPVTDGTKKQEEDVFAGPAVLKLVALGLVDLTLKLVLLPILLNASCVDCEYMDEIVLYVELPEVARSTTLGQISLQTCHCLYN